MADPRRSSCEPEGSWDPGALDRHRPAEAALVESDEVDIDGARADSRQSEYRGERGSAPLRTADSTGAPLTTGGRSTHDRPPEAPPVTPALQVRDHRLTRQVAEVIQGELDRLVDRGTLYAEPIPGDVDSGRGRVVSDKKKLVGGDHPVEQFEAGLEVGRVLYEGSGFFTQGTSATPNSEADELEGAGGRSQAANTAPNPPTAKIFMRSRRDIPSRRARSMSAVT